VQPSVLLSVKMNPMAQIKILVVEDSTIIAMFVRHELFKLGYEEAEFATDGAEAIQMADTLRPDVILMDISLNSSMDGIEAAKYIHRNFGTPIVYMTGTTDDIIIQRAINTAPVGFLPKPFELDELRETVEIAANCCP